VLVPATVIPMIAFTLVVLAKDGIDAQRWSFTRQSFDALTSGSACGLAGELEVTPRPVRPLHQVSEAASPDPPRWAKGRPFGSGDVFRLRPIGNDANASSGWYRLPVSDGELGVAVVGFPGPADSLLLEWGLIDRASGGVKTVAMYTIHPTAPSRGWWIARDPHLSNRPPADALRVHLESNGGALSNTPARLALGPAVAFDAVPLATLLSDETHTTLVGPNLLPYFPCAQLPEVVHGRAEPPTYVITDDKPFVLDSVDSPFHGMEEIGRKRRVTVLNPIDPQLRVLEFPVRRGWRILPVERHDR
jgi:hypothetical protein